MEKFNLFFLLAVIHFSAVFALECYTCADQDNNKDKCVKTTKQCEQHQDACSATIRWAIPPYWTPRGDRIYFVSKDCTTRTKCQDDKYRLRNSCKRDWYLDWACHECCTGDMCNYYVTLGSSQVSSSMLMLCLSITFSLVLTVVYS